MIEGVPSVAAAVPGTPPPDTSRTSGEPPTAATAGTSFDEVLAAVGESRLVFSKHALRRIQQRELHFDRSRVERLEQAVERAAAKGSRDSLVLLDEIAVVVSVRNQTVVTAVDGSRGGEQVFTNVDSVVIAG